MVVCQTSLKCDFGNICLPHPPDFTWKMAFLGYFRLLYTNKRDKADTHTTKRRPGVYFITTDAFLKENSSFLADGHIAKHGLESPGNVGLALS